MRASAVVIMKSVVMFGNGSGEPQMKTKRDRSPPRDARDPHAESKTRVAAYLARAGLKRSRARDAVIDVFLGIPGHVSVEEQIKKDE
jgi:hypothetical protein